MCRLYAFHANEETKVECSLVHAQNALMLQSRADSLGRAHPHGWGLAFYHDSHPTVVRRAAAAYEDIHFNETVEKIFTRSVVAHVRYATVGEPSIANTHPFCYGPWTFAHNGTVTGFDQLHHSMKLLPEFAHLRAGATDSEHSFYWLLSRLKNAGIDVTEQIQDVEMLRSFVANAVYWLAERSQQILSTKPAKLNFVLTDGRTVIATRWGNSLSWTSREGVHDCEICGIPHIHHQDQVDYRAVVIASEPVTHNEAWQEVPDRSVMSVDAEMNLRIEPILDCHRLSLE